jgi:hypothetical protein
VNPNMPEHYGLAAIGKAGRFTVEILEGSAASRLMGIEAAGWSFTFTLNGPDLAEILAHLRGDCKASELRIGVFLGATVTLIRDDEFSDRYFLRTFKDGHVLDFVLAADQLVQFADAIAQALDDLAS